MKHCKLLLGFVSVILVLACSRDHSQAGQTRLKVITSIAPIHCFARNVVGEHADLEQLLPPGADPHGYSFKPGDVKKLSEANIFIINNIGLEDWLDSLVKAAGNPKLQVVNASEGIPLLQGDELLQISRKDSQDHQHHLEHEHGHGHKHSKGQNPHVWLDPVLARKQVENIALALSKADPANATNYQQNAERYLEKLEQLHQDFQARLGPLKNRNLITLHNAFPYLAKRYEMNYLGYFEAFPGKSPTAREIGGLLKMMKEHSVKVVFTEKGAPSRLLHSISKEASATVVELDTLESGEPGEEFYVERMRRNLDALEAAWR